jgi:hypothetical protein
MPSTHKSFSSSAKHLVAETTESPLRSNCGLLTKTNADAGARMTLIVPLRGAARRFSAAPTLLRRALLATALMPILALSVRAELIPATRLIDWKLGVTVGVPGGIPTNRTNLIDVSGSPYRADRTGATDASSAIQAAIDAAKSGDVVYVPAGTYRLDKTLILKSRNGITLRGSGATTVMKLYGASGFVYLGAPPNWNWPTSGNMVTGGLKKGSTVITVADTSGFTVGNNVLLGMANDAALPVVSVQGYDLSPYDQPMRRQLTRVVSKTSTTLTISPALYADYSATAVKAWSSQFQANFTGVEDFRVEAGNSTHGRPLTVESSYGCWVSNVHVKGAKNVSLYISGSLQCEVRRCFLDELQNGNSPNGAGLMVETTSGCLFEDNIIQKAFPLIEVIHGAAGNVFAYNFLYDSLIGIDTNHGPHNNFNLYEGNVSPHIMADGFYGSVSDDTLFRNWFTGMNPAGPTYTTSLKRFTRNYSFVGNVLGTSGKAGGGYDFGGPNMGNGTSSGTAQPSAGDDWDDRGRIGTLSTRSGNNAGIVSLPAGATGIALEQWPITVRWSGGVRNWMQVVAVNNTSVTLGDGERTSNGDPLPPQGTAVQLWVGANGFQEIDLDVEPTTIRKGNYLARTEGGGGIPSSEALNGETLPDSLFRSTKPAYFGTLAWPPVDPLAPNQKYDAIPAGYRFLNGTNPPGGDSNEPAPAPTTQPPSNVKIQIQTQ